MANAQVSYGDTFWGSYNMKINVSTENDFIFLNVIYTDEKRKLTDTPKLLLRLMDDSVISLEGVNMSSQSKSDGGVILYGVYVESNLFISEAKFPITKEQILLLEKGVKKLRLNTSPKFHEKEWSRDKHSSRCRSHLGDSSDTGVQLPAICNSQDSHRTRRSLNRCRKSDVKRWHLTNVVHIDTI